MSEENEYTSEETEPDIRAENQSQEQSKSEISVLNNVEEQSMLEDQEMPTYISVSNSSRHNDSAIDNTEQQNTAPVEDDNSQGPNNEQGGSVCILVSSGDEESTEYNDDDRDEYPDSDEIDDMDLDHDNAMMDEDEDDDEDDDPEINSLRDHNDDMDDMETEYERDCFDRVSDDFVINNRSKHHDMERSLSLQDLSTSANSLQASYHKKAHGVFKQNFFTPRTNPMVYPSMHRKQLLPLKYQHVESKVKQYIRGIKEQNRKSMERRSKEHYVVNKNHEEKYEDDNTEQLKAIASIMDAKSGNIKNYVKEAINDLQREEAECNNLFYNAGQILENGENNKYNNVLENQHKSTHKEAEYNDIQNEKHIQNCEDKVEKRNGSVDVNEHHIEYDPIVNMNVRLSGINQPSLVNGQQTPAFINLRTLSYEEYMQNASAAERQEELPEQRQERATETEIYNDTEMIDAQEVDNSNTSCPLKIENVKSICTIQEEPENLNFAKINAERINAQDAEIIDLKAQLSQKDAQYQTLQSTYHKTVAENIRMKQELEELRKSLASYEEKNKTCETKVAAVQTETTKDSASNEIAATSGEASNRISATSIASTVNSDPWAESAVYSPAVSIKPPDLNSILNSDDSLPLTNGITPKKINPLSRAFITSSRILQTLSNITQSKVENGSPLLRNTLKQLNENSADQSLNLSINSPIHASSSKKRKATDMIGASTFVQPFKIPHTSMESERKDSDDTNDVEFEYSMEHMSVKEEPKENTSIDPSMSEQSKTENPDNQEDDVKCFVYKENNNSKNRSFLIQAEESTKNHEKNRIQECGPYLLGNLEVRMSEINGTISVWGKEVNLESTSDNENDIETSVRPSETKTCQNTSNTRFNGSSFTCSSTKKQKLPLKLNKHSTINQCCHSLNLTKPRFSENGHMDNCCNPSTSALSCDNSNSSQCHREWLTCKGASSSKEEIHSCCTHRNQTVDKVCICGTCNDKSVLDVSPKCCKDKCHNIGIRRSLDKNAFIGPKNCVHEKDINDDIRVNELICKHHRCRHSLQNTVDNCLQSNCCNTVREVSCMCNFNVQSSNGINNQISNSSSYRFSNNVDEVPLIPLKNCNETTEMRQRRSSGKKVRGILMDLLKGCGHCRSNSISSNKNEHHHKESSRVVNDSSQVKVSCTSEPIPSTSTQHNDRCNTCRCQIESQLEEFRIEMERIRSRSDAILDKLNTLHFVDMN